MIRIITFLFFVGIFQFHQTHTNIDINNIWVDKYAKAEDPNYAYIMESYVSLSTISNYSDIREGWKDVNGNPVNNPNYNKDNTDVAMDYLPNFLDTDGDGIPDNIDLDDDNDGISDYAELVGSCDTYSNYSFDDLQQISGSENQVGAVYRYSNVAEGVDATITIESAEHGAIITAFDRTNIGTPANFQPSLRGDYVNSPDEEPSITFRFDFFEAGTETPIVIPRFFVSPIDIDGQSNYTETVEMIQPTGVMLENNSHLTATQSENTLRVTGADHSQSGIGSDTRYIAYLIYQNVTSLRYKILISGDNTDINEERWFSIRFTPCEIDNFSDPVFTGEFPDTDGDGITDNLDLDSDNDGITDFVENGVPASYDTNNDGRVDEEFDNNNNGIADDLEGDNAIIPVNNDGDEYPDFLDIDADNDGIPDNVEGQSTSDYVAPSGTDSNNNGLDDAYENDTSTGIVPENTDGEDVPDYLDEDSDNDGESDTTEAGYNESTDSTDNDFDGLLDNYDDNVTPGEEFDVNDDLDSGSTTLPDEDVDQSTEEGDVDYRDDTNSITINASNDMGNPVTVIAGGESVSNVLENDTLNGETPTITDVILTQLSSEHLNISLNTATGSVTVAPGTPPGNYTLEYQICATANETVCDTATVQINVTIDTDGDGVPDYSDIDDDNDGILDVDECPTSEDSNIDGFITNATFDITGDPSEINDQIYLNSIEIDGVVYTDFVMPSAFSINAPSITNPENVQLVDNGVGSGIYIDNENYETLALPYFQDRNLNNYQQVTGSVSNDDYYELTFSPPLRAGNGIFIVITERQGNNTGEVQAFSSDGNNLGEVVRINANSASYLPTGHLQNNSQDVRLAILPLDDLASVNQEVNIIRYYFAHNGDEGDGKIFSFGNQNLAICDADGDGIPNSLDIDADNDGITDNIEGQSTGGYIAPSGNDADGDGLDDAYEGEDGDEGINPEDTDGDNTPDYLDQDSDNDGIEDIAENGHDDNTLSGNDSDNDGLDDNFDDVDDSNGTWTPDDNQPPTADNYGDIDDDVDNGGDLDYRDIPTIDAIDNEGITVTVNEGGVAVTNVLDNDTLNGNPIVSIEDVILTQVSSTHEGVSLNAETGEVSVEAGTPAGEYTLEYQICDAAHSDVCDIAVVTVTVISEIDAVDDQGTPVTVNEGGVAVTNVLDNDTLNGNSIESIEDVILTQVSSTHEGVSLNTETGEVNVEAGTPAGEYTLEYQICDAVHPNVCDIAVVTVTVVPSVIINAVDDVIDSSTQVILDNDTLNGNSITIDDVILMQIDTTSPLVNIDITDGTVEIDPNTPDGVYYITYEICDVISSTVCDTAIVEVEVVDGGVTSGNEGGIESNGSLALLIGKRNFVRTKTNSFKNKKGLQSKILLQSSNVLSRNFNNDSSLFSLFPETGAYGIEDTFKSSPTDLIPVTNAVDISSVDYYKGERRVAVGFATRSIDRVYDHTKAICDRLRRAKLENINTYTINGHKMIGLEMRRSNGVLEHGAVFSVKLGEETNELKSFWNLHHYPEGDYLNFQAWGTTKAQVKHIVAHILSKLETVQPLTSNANEVNIPKVFVKSGYYENGKLKLEIINKIGATEAIFYGTSASTETTGREGFNQTKSLTGDFNQYLEVDINKLFDVGISMAIEGQPIPDILYLADGPWAVDEDPNKASVNAYTVKQYDIDYRDEAFEIERSVEVAGTVKESINVFRHILPGGQALNISEYETLEFSIKNKQQVEVILLTKGNSWNDRFKYSITANKNETFYSIPLRDFSSQNSNLELKDVNTVVFSLKGNGVTFENFELKLTNVAFGVLNIENNTTNEIITTDLNSVKPEVLTNYPNPFNDYTTFKLPNKSRSVKIKILNLNGSVLDTQIVKVQNAYELKYIPSFKLQEGIYIYEIYDDNGITYIGKVLVKN